MGLLDGIFGGGGTAADDPYADILTPAQRNQMQVQGLLAMAGAFADAGMPSRLPIPFGAALGKAAQALGTGQEAGMKTALENALAAQKVRDLRTTAEFRKQFFGDQDKLYQAIQGVIGPGGTAAPASTRPAGTTPSAGTDAGTGTAGAGGGGLLSPDLSLGSDTEPDYFTRGLTPKAPGGLLDYPEAAGGMAAGGALVRPQPFAANLGTKTPTDQFRPPLPGSADRGTLYPFKDLGVVPGGGGGGAAATAPSAAATPNAETQIPGAYYDATEGLKVPGMPGYDPSRAGKAPPPVTSTPGPTNGIDPRRRAALDAILGGIQTAQAGPAAQRLPQFAGPGAADAPAADTVPEGGGLLGVAPDLRAPIEANPFARQASPGDPRGVAPLIRQAMLRQGVDPNVALRVAQSEGLGTFLGDAGKSGGAFQLYTGGGLGNEFQKQTGLDPLDPANEAATIDWVAKNVNRTGWSPYHGAANVGIGPRTGLPGGDLPPPDQVIPSGPAGGGGRPPVMQAQYAPGAGAGGAPMQGAPGAALPAMPQVPVPPGADPARMNALLLELARRNAAAEVLGMGNPYGSLLGVLQGSPQYKAAVEAATEAAKRGAGLPFIGPEETAKRAAGLPFIEPEKAAGAAGEYPYLVSRDINKAALDRVNKTVEQLGAAALDPVNILVKDPSGQTVERQGTRYQQMLAANGFSVPELGIKGMYPAPAAGQTPNIPGLAQPAGPGSPARPTPEAQAVTPGEPGTVAGKPIFTPEQTKSQELGATAGWKAIEDTHAAERAALTKDQQLGQLAQAMQGFTPGATADVRVRAQAVLKDLGFIKGDEVPSAETFQRVARAIQINAVAGKGQGSISNYERELIAEGSLQMTNTPEGAAQAIGIMQRLNNYDKAVAEIHRNVAMGNNGNPNLLEAQRRIAALGPPLSPGEISALEQIRAGKVPGPAQGTGAADLSPDAKPIGTYQGKPVYQMPDGSRKVLQ